MSDFSLATIFNSWSEFYIVAGIFFIAQFIYVLFGFGAGLFAIGILALILSNTQDIVVILLLVCMPIELWIVLRSLKKINFGLVVIISIGIVLGIPLGTWLLVYISPSIILWILGGLLFIIGSSIFIQPRVKYHSRYRWIEFIIGLISGSISGLLGIGGPPLVAYFQAIKTNKETFRINLIAIFLVTTITRIVSYSICGLITEPRLLSSLLLLPIAIAGALLGQKIFITISELIFKYLVGSILIATSISLLLR